MSENQEKWYSHEMKTARSILMTGVGYNFGPEPESKIDEIRESRYRVGRAVCHRLKVTSEDRVADIGSGCGFVTRAACEVAREVHCFDMSKDFLDFTRNELSSFSNAHFHQIEYGKLPVEDGSLDKVYSTAVFIHFYYYDFLFYLTEVNRALAVGGSFYVEIVDSDILSLAEMRATSVHVKNYRQSLRSARAARMIQPFSLTALKNLAGQLGFEVLNHTHSGDVAAVVLRKKEDAQLPQWFSDIL